MTPTVTPQHYLLSDAARLLDLSTKHLRKVIKRERLSFERTGIRPGFAGIQLLTKADVEKLAAATKRKINWCPCRHCGGTGRSNES